MEKPIIWCSMDKPSDINLYRECRDVIEPNVSGIYLNYCQMEYQEMKDFALSLPNSFCIYDKSDVIKFSKYYAGEYITNDWWHGKMDEVLKKFEDKILVDEASIKFLEAYLPYKCKIAFSNYRRYILFLEDWFGWRIPIPFTNQIWAYEWIKKTFGKNRIGVMWVSLRLNEGQYPILIKYATDNNLDIGVFVDSNIPKEVFLKRWNKFLTK